MDVINISTFSIKVVYTRQTPYTSQSKQEELLDPYSILHKAKQLSGEKQSSVITFEAFENGYCIILSVARCMQIIIDTYATRGTILCFIPIFYCR